MTAIPGLASTPRLAGCRDRDQEPPHAQPPPPAQPDWWRRRRTNHHQATPASAARPLTSNFRLERPHWFYALWLCAINIVQMYAISVALSNRLPTLPGLAFERRVKGPASGCGAVIPGRMTAPARVPKVYGKVTVGVPVELVMRVALTVAELR
jgi:hypothetical protein